MMANDFVHRWSGPAAAIGGFLWLLPWTGWLEMSDTVRLLISFPGILLVGVGLTGLYRLLAANGGRGNIAAYDLVLIGLLLIITPLIANLITGPEESADAPPILVVVGVIIMVLGLAAMGIQVISRKVLGALSVIPLALAGGYVGFLVSFGLSVNNPSIEGLGSIFTSITILCWLLLGVALWSRRAESAEIAYP